MKTHPMSTQGLAKSHFNNKLITKTFSTFRGIIAMIGMRISAYCKFSGLFKRGL